VWPGEPFVTEHSTNIGFVYKCVRATVSVSNITLLCTDPATNIGLLTFEMNVSAEHIKKH
jgi:hypothetical protein